MKGMIEKSAITRQVNLHLFFSDFSYRFYSPHPSIVVTFLITLWYQEKSVSGLLEDFLQNLSSLDVNEEDESSPSSPALPSSPASETIAESEEEEEEEEEIVEESVAAAGPAVSYDNDMLPPYGSCKHIDPQDIAKKPESSQGDLLFRCHFRV